MHKFHKFIAKFSKSIRHTTSSEHQELNDFMDNNEEFRMNPVRFVWTEAAGTLQSMSCKKPGTIQFIWERKRLPNKTLAFCHEHRRTTKVKSNEV